MKMVYVFVKENYQNNGSGFQTSRRCWDAFWPSRCLVLPHCFPKTLIRAGQGLGLVLRLEFASCFFAVINSLFSNTDITRGIQNICWFQYLICNTKYVVHICMARIGGTRLGDRQAASSTGVDSAAHASLIEIGYVQVLSSIHWGAKPGIFLCVFSLITWFWFWFWFWFSSFWAETILIPVPFIFAVGNTP